MNSTRQRREKSVEKSCVTVNICGKRTRSSSDALRAAKDSTAIRGRTFNPRFVVLRGGAPLVPRYAAVHVNRLTVDNTGSRQRQKRHDVCDVVRLVASANALGGENML